MVTGPNSHRLLLFCTCANGGIADYSHNQANALIARGVEVTILAPWNWDRRNDQHYELAPVLRGLARQSSMGTSRWLQRARQACRTILDYMRLAQYTRKNGYRHVLLASYSEYGAPLWSRWLRKLSAQGIIFGAIVHDPVRDYRIGPPWWHQWSLASGYSFLREAFVHQSIVLNTVRPMRQLRTTVIPHGLYRMPAARLGRQAMRARLNLPDNATVLLAFGQIRDGKNLHLGLEAMRYFPNIYLIVAGQETFSRNKGAAYYQSMAEELGVAGRCRWLTYFIPEEDISDIFGAADVLLLTYSQSFRSASGVVNTAVAQRKVCIASAGDSNLRSSVREYSLGVWVEPDDVDSLIHGIHTWLTSPPSPRWEDYENDHSWDSNAVAVQEAFWGDGASRTSRGAA